MLQTSTCALVGLGYDIDAAYMAVRSLGFMVQSFKMPYAEAVDTTEEDSELFFIAQAPRAVEAAYVSGVVQ